MLIYSQSAAILLVACCIINVTLSESAQSNSTTNAESDVASLGDTQKSTMKSSAGDRFRRDAPKQVRKTSSASKSAQELISGKQLACKIIENKYLDVNSTVVMKPNSSQLAPGDSIVIECLENHYFKEDAYRITGQQILTCKGNDIWQDMLHDNVKADQAPAKCDYGCPVPTKKQLENVTVISIPSVVISSGDNKFHVKQSVLVLKCNIDKGFIQNTEKERMVGDERLVCKGGRGGWYNTKTVQDNSVVGKCEPVCKPITKDRIDQNANLVREASTLQQAQIDYARSGSVTELKCNNGYQFRDPLHRDENSQRLICKGGQAQWYDTKTANNNAQVDTCEPADGRNTTGLIKPGRPEESTLSELLIDGHACLQL